jgi:hypothetical protein
VTDNTVGSIELAHEFLGYTAVGGQRPLRGAVVPTVTGPQMVYSKAPGAGGDAAMGG